MNNKQTNYTDDIEFYINNTMKDFIKEMYGQFPNKYIDIFRDSFINETVAFCNLILTDDENTFKENADVFKKRVISRIFEKTLTDCKKNILPFYRLGKKYGINFVEDNAVEKLHAGIVSFIYIDMLSDFFEDFYVCFANRESKEIQKKMEYLLN